MKRLLLVSILMISSAAMSAEQLRPLKMATEAHGKFVSECIYAAAELKLEQYQQVAVSYAACMKMKYTRLFNHAKEVRDAAEEY